MVRGSGGPSFCAQLGAREPSHETATQPYQEKRKSWAWAFSLLSLPPQRGHPSVISAFMSSAISGLGCGLGGRKEIASRSGSGSGSGVLLYKWAASAMAIRSGEDGDDICWRPRWRRLGSLGGLDGSARQTERGREKDGRQFHSRSLSRILAPPEPGIQNAPHLEAALCWVLWPHSHFTEGPGFSASIRKYFWRSKKPVGVSETV